jgi:hypothetical protein
MGDSEGEVEGLGFGEAIGGVGGVDVEEGGGLGEGVGGVCVV